MTATPTSPVLAIAYGSVHRDDDPAPDRGGTSTFDDSNVSHGNLRHSTTTPASDAAHGQPLRELGPRPGGGR